MPDEVLSQSEIDKLLSAINEGTINAEEVKTEDTSKKVKTYDFRRPDKFSKDQIRTLRMLHESFARLFNTYLSTHLRSLVSIDVASVEQLTYQEFVQSMANPSVISILSLPPLKGNIIIELNTEVAFAFIDRVLGGEGNASTKARTLTEIEDAMMKKFMESAVANLKDAWANVVEIHPHVETMESNPQFAQIVSPSDMVIIVTIQVSICGVEGMMNICVPYLVLEPIMSKLTTTFWVASSQAKDDMPEHVEILQRKIERTRVPFIVELGNVYISIQEFMTLRFGDVLQLDTNVQDQLRCRVGARAKYLCRPGTAGKKVAVQITHILNEAEEESLEGDDLTNG